MIFFKVDFIKVLVDVNIELNFPEVGRHIFPAIGRDGNQIWTLDCPINAALSWAHSYNS